MVETESIEIRRRLAEDAHRRQLAEDVRTGLGSNPKSLPPKYFYDARGSRLFEAITRLPEYYQTRTERSILEQVSRPLVAGLRPRVLVEYGSGSADKTRILLDAMDAAGLLEAFVPIDVSPEPVRETARRLTERYGGLRVVGLIADFESDVEIPFRELPRLFLFLGSTIGNLREEEAVDFLHRVEEGMTVRDGFLVGFDLVKDRETLERAYDDEAGVTAEFNRNVLRVLNRELDADFDPDAFRHDAAWNPGEERIEIRLVAEGPQRVRIGELEMEVDFEAGESILTELSHKYTRASASALLERAGLSLGTWWSDPDGLFALALARRD